MIPITLKSILAEFDEKFTRLNLGSKNKGKYMPDWFIKDGVKSKDIKDFLTKAISQSIDEVMVEKASGKKTETAEFYEKNTTHKEALCDGWNSCRQQMIDNKNNFFSENK